MGGFLRAREDRPTPKQVYNRRLYSQAVIIATGSVLFGYDSAFIGTTIARQSFQTSFHIHNADATDVSSNITSAFQAGAFFGAIICLFLTEEVGRKWALQAHVVVFLVGAALMTAATDQLSYIYAGRVLTGLACGAVTATVPSYIAELSVVSIRGILTGLFEVAYQLGSLAGFWINYAIDQHMGAADASWRVPMAVQLVPASLLFLGGFALYESPLWLMRRNKEEAATRVLEAVRQLSRHDTYVQEDLAMMRTRLADESRVARRFGKGSWALFRGTLHQLCREGMRNRVWLVFCAFALQNMSGAAAINYYSPTLFASLGVRDVAFYTGIYGLVKALASLAFYGILVDLWGRRRPTILSSLACSVCLWFVGGYVRFSQDVASGQHSGGGAAMAAIIVYSVFWSFGLNGIPWIVSAEIFPGALRNLAGAWAALVQWLTQFAMAKALPYIFASLGYGTWWFFASWMLVAAVWAFFLLPETKGKTIDEMDAIFRAGRASAPREELMI